MNNLQEAYMDALGMERVSILDNDGVDFDTAYAMQQRIDSLEEDCMTLALRLLGEDFDTFAPETREVMERWGKKAYEALQNEDHALWADSFDEHTKRTTCTAHEDSE